MEDYKDRIKEELSELEGKLGKLEAFISTPKFDKLESSERGKLIVQSDIMKQYVQVLEDRLQ